MGAIHPVGWLVKTRLALGSLCAWLYYQYHPFFTMVVNLKRLRGFTSSCDAVWTDGWISHVPCCLFVNAAKFHFSRTFCKESSVCWLSMRSYTHVYTYTGMKSLKISKCLWSSSTATLRTWGDSSFSVTAPRLWNHLPTKLKSCHSITTCRFKSLLKTHLMSQCTCIFVIALYMYLIILFLLSL